MHGITLIALVVTIVVLLILAGITISLIFNKNGVISKAQEAKKSTEISAVIEMAKMDILGIQMENGGEISKKQFIEVLNKYFENVPTEDISQEDLMNTELKTKNEYGENNIKVSDIYDGIFPKTVEDLKAGEKVNYIDKNGNTIECVVLYDSEYNNVNNTNYGIQIITSDIVDTVTLGTEDNFEESKEAYNNALGILYNKAQEYLNTTYAESARCIGSNPANPEWDTTENEAGYYTMNPGDDNYNYDIANYGWGGILKNGDDNADIDNQQLEELNIKRIGKEYWLASRFVGVNYDYNTFGIMHCGKNPRLEL